MSENIMDQFTKKLVAENVFNCDSCKNLLVSPIMIVENIGNVCNDCYQKNNWSGLTNTRLELILKELKVPCSYQTMGCCEHVLFNELIEHEKNCKYQIKKCLWYLTCDWQGIQTDFITHLIDQHSEHVLDNQNNSFIIDIDLNEFTPIVKLLKYKTECYLFNIHQDNDRNCLIYKICDLKRNESDHRCRIKHIGKTPNYIDIDCKLSSLNDFINNQLTDNRIELESLKLITKIIDNFTIEISINNPNEMREFDERMLQFFECPVCKCLMKPPIYQCTFGHSICNVCRPKLEKCPTCRGIFGNTRNFSLEAITAGINYTCQYQHLGCNEILTSSESSKHEVVCIYKPYPCPLNDCQFTGNHLTILPHLNNFHSDRVIVNNFYKTTVELRLEQLLDYYSASQKIIMLYDDNIFRLNFRRNTDYGFWAVEVLRQYGEQSNYVYEIGIVDMRKPDRKLIRTDLCFNETNSDDIYKKCILFPNNTLASYASNGVFTYYCEIYKLANSQ